VTVRCTLARARRHAPRVALALAAGVVSQALLLAPPAGAAETTVSRFTFDAERPRWDSAARSDAQLRGDISATRDFADLYGRSVVESAHRSDLNPGVRDFRVGVSVALTRGAGNWNIAQKGYYGNAGQWKLDMRERRGGVSVGCRVKGTAGAVRAWSPPGAIETGSRWYSLACHRVGDRVQVLVDGRVVASAQGPIGHVANTKPYLIGSKGMNARDHDQFLGRLDDAYVSVG
jgi:hypothetical protein